MPRAAATFGEAREAARAFKGKPLENNHTPIVAAVSGNNLEKMLSGKAVGKSSTETAHSLAVANLDYLFKRAICGWKKPDEKNDINIVAIHRFFAPMETADRKMILTKLTVKETIDQTHPHPLYTVEAVDFNEKSPAAQWVGDSAKLDKIPITTRSVGDVLILAEAIQKYNALRKGHEMELSNEEIQAEARKSLEDQQFHAEMLRERAERLKAAKGWTQEEAEREADADLERFGDKQYTPGGREHQVELDKMAELAKASPHYRAQIEALSPSLLGQHKPLDSITLNIPPEPKSSAEMERADLERLRMRVRSEADILETPEDSRSELLSHEARDGRGREYNFEEGREELEALRARTRSSASATPEDSRSELLGAETREQLEAEEKERQAREAERLLAMEEGIRLRKEREQREYMAGLAEMDQPSGRELGRGDYIVPRSIAQSYTEIEGKFYEKTTKNPKVMFEDKGEKLSTSTTDSKAIADMVTLAKAKQWGNLKLSGSQEFRREAWLQAESQGIKTKGYTPKEADMAALETLRQERETNIIQPVHERQTERQATQEKVAPRHDINKNQPQMHANATAHMAENLQTLKRNPALAGKPPETLERLAYQRGITQEWHKDKPQSLLDEKLAHFDKEAENPAFLEKLEKSETFAQERAEKECPQEQRQERKDTYEQSI